MGTIELLNLRKEFGDLVAVDDVSLEVNAGELLCLLGPSGCGKSTTLRMLDGLERPTSGRVFIGDDEVTDQQPYERDCSMVFQSWALFPYKSVVENVAFGLKMKGVGKSERRERARETLDLMQMVEYADSRPAELSGGQKQRVALARSLAMDPAVLLLDEPLSNLDKKLREEMQLELKNIHEEFGKTMVHVTHDQDEAFTLADRIGIMNDGRLVQIGTPREVYRNPKNRFVEEFIGETNLLSGYVTELDDDGIVADLPGEMRLPVPIAERTDDLEPGASISVSLRPEAIDLERADADDADADRAGDAVANGRGDRQYVTGRIRNLLYRGNTVRYFVDVGEVELFLERSGSNAEYEDGDVIDLSWDPEELLCFDESGRTVWC